MDGLRYVASLQSVDDPCCYKDFHEGTVFEEAKTKADEAAEKHNRSALVYDRKQMAITYKKVIENKVEKPLEVKKKKNDVRTATKQSKRTVTKDDYFD